MFWGDGAWSADRAGEAVEGEVQETQVRFAQVDSHKKINLFCILVIIQDNFWGS